MNDKEILLNELRNQIDTIDKEIVYLCLLSWFSVVMFYGLQTGFLDYVIQDYFPSYI